MKIGALCELIRQLSLRWFFFPVSAHLHPSLPLWYKDCLPQWCIILHSEAVTPLLTEKYVNAEVRIYIYFYNNYFLSLQLLYQFDNLGIMLNEKLISLVIHPFALLCLSYSVLGEGLPSVIMDKSIGTNWDTLVLND